MKRVTGGTITFTDWLTEEMALSRKIKDKSSTIY
jgi:hypothetical protein